MSNITDKLDNLKCSLKSIIYKKKIKEFNISDEFLKAMLSKDRKKDFSEILKAIRESSSKDEFNSRIINMVSKKHSSYAPNMMLSGVITGSYNLNAFIQVNPSYNREINYHNLLMNFSEVKDNLKSGFIPYLYNNQEYKNKFLGKTKDVLDLTLDLDQEEVLRTFEEVTNGETRCDSDQVAIINGYLLNTIGVYGSDMIKNDLDFVIHDISEHHADIPIEERREEYYKYTNLNENQLKEIKNIEKLKNKLKTISSKEASILLDKLNNISEISSDNIDEIEDIYRDYEIIFRQDIVDHLYNPKEDVTLVKDFRDTKDQLLHIFLRDPSIFEGKLISEIEQDIKSKRLNKSDEPLTNEEQKELEKRTSKIEAEIDPTNVNYSFNYDNNMYSDQNGFDHYHSDTSNQISASIFSSEYFVTHNISAGLMGIGFDSQGLTPEAIALSSPYYITTNKGLNNVEYSNNSSFDYESSTFKELKNNDGRSEVVLFRRNMDYDTKASYVFLTIDSRKETTDHDVERAKALADKNHLKLVLYDTYKIRQSYEQYSKDEINYDNQSAKAL